MAKRSLKEIKETVDSAFRLAEMSKENGVEPGRVQENYQFARLLESAYNAMVKEKNETSIQE